LSRKVGRPVRPLAASALAELEAHDWPGNIRELQNTIARADLVHGRRSDDRLAARRRTERRAVFSSCERGRRDARRERLVCWGRCPATTLVEVERRHIVSTLKRTGGVIEGPKGAAKVLDMKPSTMRYRIRKLGIRKIDYL
jgi:formate hydrogenlyase transcriptional activator